MIDHDLSWSTTNVKWPAMKDHQFTWAAFPVSCWSDCPQVQTRSSSPALVSIPCCTNHCQGYKVTSICVRRPSSWGSSRECLLQSIINLHHGQSVCTMDMGVYNGQYFKEHCNRAAVPVTEQWKFMGLASLIYHSFQPHMGGTMGGSPIHYIFRAVFAIFSKNICQFSKNLSIPIFLTAIACFLF